ncbi:MAG TPA: flagellar basal-body rod protein FlgF [Desulfobacteria bacterium]|nr:flagellar basal-body rod protein FlgF [Desulfobacteria bacterium]
MIRGLYTSASGMMAEMVRNDVTANNMANVNTTGYKKDSALFMAFPEVLISRINDDKKTDFRKPPVIGSLGTGAIVDEVVTDHDQGQLRETSNPFDLAISGDGYFVVQNPNGTFFTRNGSFTQDSRGYLVNSKGDYLMGDSGPVRVGNADNVTIDESGNIFESGDKTGAIRLVNVPDQTTLVKTGDSLFNGAEAFVGITGQVKQRFLENSNVNVINEMVNMITIQRAYEANQKVITAHDQTLGQAMDVGRLR